MLAAMRACALFRLTVTSSACGLLLAAVMATPASGEGGKRVSAARASDASAGATATRYDPDNVTGMSQSMEALVKGTERFQAKDYPAAIDLYRKSIQLNPKSPLAPYLMGEAQLAANNVSEAEAAFKQAEELTDARNTTLRAHVLFSVADVSERQKKWPQAKSAWQTYAEHAAKYADAGVYPQSASSRLEAIEAVLELDAHVVEVRARIAAEKAAAADAGAKAPPPKR
jgi:tetratricopeptide (TPR) repeat protein